MPQCPPSTPSPTPPPSPYYNSWAQDNSIDLIAPQIIKYEVFQANDGTLHAPTDPQNNGIKEQ